jgi:hypothetical protein
VKDLVQRIGDENVTVTMRIVQPRSYHWSGPIREWTVKASDLRGHFNRLQMAAEIAMQPDPPTVAGRHCRHCPARRGCRANQAYSMWAADVPYKAVPHDLPAQAVGIELRTLKLAADMLKARIEALEEQARAMMQRGESVPLWKMQSEPGREKWTADPATVFALGDAMNIDLRKPTEPVTPNQARTKGLSPELVAAFATRPNAAIKLIPDDGADARRVFKP